MAWLVSKAQWFWSHRPDLQFGWIVLMLSGYLIWEAWDQKPAARFQANLFNIILALLGGGLMFVYQIYEAALGTMPASLVGLAFAVMCIILANLNYVFGWAGVRHFLFGFGFILIALPMPSAVHGLIVGGLQRHIATANVEILNLIGIPAQQLGSIIRLPNCQVGVDEACSGIRSLQSTIMATLFIGHLTLKRMGMKAVLLACGIGLALVGNLFRSLFLSYSANARGPQAIEALHDAAGWSILLFTAGGVILLSWIFTRVERLALAASQPGRDVESASAVGAS